MSRFNKMPRPRPNRAHSLWRQCVWAFCAGWEKGFREDGTQDDSAVEDQRQVRGRWVGSLDENNYTVRDFCRALDAGGSIDRIEWQDVNNCYDLQGTNRPITAAVLVRPDAVQSDDRLFFTKKAGIDIGHLGWSWGTGFAGATTWRFEISDGGTERFADTTTLQSTSRSDLLVATYDATDLFVYVNGVREGSAVGGGTLIGNNDEPVRLFGQAGAGNSNTVIAMAAFWNRILSASEIAQLNSDPYVMWRSDLHKEFMFGPGAFGFQTFFTNFG